MKEAERAAAESVDHGAQVDVADDLHVADEEGDLTRQLARRTALDLALSEICALLLPKESPSAERGRS
jgi:hypothetical protein